MPNLCRFWERQSIGEGRIEWPTCSQERKSSLRTWRMRFLTEKEGGRGRRRSSWFWSSFRRSRAWKFSFPFFYRWWVSSPHRSCLWDRISSVFKRLNVLNKKILERFATGEERPHQRLYAKRRKQMSNRAKRQRIVMQVFIKAYTLR